MYFYIVLALLLAYYCIYGYLLHLYTKALRSGEFIHLPLKRRLAVKKMPGKSAGFRVFCYPERCGSISVHFNRYVLLFQPQYKNNTKHLLRS